MTLGGASSKQSPGKVKSGGASSKQSPGKTPKVKSEPATKSAKKGAAKPKMKGTPKVHRNATEAEAMYGKAVKAPNGKHLFYPEERTSFTCVFHPDRVYSDISGLSDHLRTCKKCLG